MQKADTAKLLNRQIALVAMPYFQWVRLWKECLLSRTLNAYERRLDSN